MKKLYIFLAGIFIVADQTTLLASDPKRTTFGDVIALARKTDPAASFLCPTCREPIALGDWQHYHRLFAPQHEDEQGRKVGYDIVYLHAHAEYTCQWTHEISEKSLKPLKRYVESQGTLIRTIKEDDQGTLYEESFTTPEGDGVIFRFKKDLNEPARVEAKKQEIIQNRRIRERMNDFFKRIELFQDDQAGTVKMNTLIAGITELQENYVSNDPLLFKTYHKKFQEKHPDEIQTEKQFLDYLQKIQSAAFTRRIDTVNTASMENRERKNFEATTDEMRNKAREARKKIKELTANPQAPRISLKEKQQSALQKIREKRAAAVALLSAQNATPTVTAVHIPQSLSDQEKEVRKKHILKRLQHNKKSRKTQE